MFERQQRSSVPTRHVRSIALATSFVVVAACSSGRNSPSQAEIERAVGVYINNTSNGVVQAIKVTKTDGMANQDGSYVADYSADIKFNSCGYFANYTSSQGWSRTTKNNGPCPANPGQVAQPPGLTRYYGAGYELKVPGKATFVRKESGWQLSVATMDMQDY